MAFFEPGLPSAPLGLLDKRMDQELGMNQDSRDSRIDQDYGGHFAGNLYFFCHVEERNISEQSKLPKIIPSFILSHTVS